MSRYEQKISNKYTPIVIISIVIVLVAVAIWFFQSSETDNNIKTKTIELPKNQNMLINKQKHQSEKIQQPRQDSIKKNQIEPKNKKPETPAERLKIKIELLKLENSDESFQTGIKRTSENLKEWFLTKNVINKFIIIVNDLSQNQMLYKHRTFIKPPGKIVVKMDSKGLYLAKQSYSRFNPLANAIEAIDVQTGLDLYIVFKPLFEKVYKEFSYPAQYRLDDIFMKAAANVIEAPIVTNRIALVKHTISYKYADKKLESLNDVEKLMIRMGPENTKKIQAKLRKLVEGVAALRE